MTGREHHAISRLPADSDPIAEPPDRWAAGSAPLMTGALKRSEARYRLLAELSSGLTLILDGGGVIRYVTPSIWRVLGLAPEALSERELVSLIHPHDRPYIERVLAATMAMPGGRCKLTFRLADRAGAWRVFEGHADPMRDRPDAEGLVIALRDVTEHVAMQEALRRTNNVLESLGQAHTDFLHGASAAVVFRQLLGDLIALTERDFGLVLQGRRNGARLLASVNLPGFAPGSVIGLSRALPLVENGLPVAARFHAAGLDPDDGEPGSDAFWCLPLFNGGVLVGLLGVARRAGDTDAAIGEELRPFGAASANLLVAYQAGEVRRRMERALVEKVAESRAAQSKLERAHAELQRLNAVKDEFVATISHELRSPLTAIKNAVSILARRRAGALTPLQERFVGMVDEQAERLNRLVNDLLDLQQLEAGRLSVVLAVDDMRQVVREVTRGFAHVFDARRLEFVLELDERPLWTAIDRDRLGQVLLNLLSNAAKFTPEGGRVVVRAARDGDTVGVSVSDNGPGIAPEDVERIFESFVRLEDGQAEGTGLGLAICKKLIEVGHGGRIWAESELGAGATFHLRLPAREEPATA